MFPVDVINIIVGYALAYEMHPYIAKIFYCDKFTMEQKIGVLCSNPHDEAINLILEDDDYWRYIKWDRVAANTCDNAVELLMNNEHMVRRYKYIFEQNMNEQAIMYNKIPDKFSRFKYLANMRNGDYSDKDINDLISWLIDCNISHDYYNYDLSRIENDKLIKFISEYKDGFFLNMSSLCGNSTDAAVDIIVKYIDKMICLPNAQKYLNQNSNDRIVTYLFENPRYIDRMCFILNTNPRVINYYNKQLRQSNIGLFKRNRSAVIYDILLNIVGDNPRNIAFNDINMLARPNIFIAKDNSELYNVLCSMRW